MIGVLILAAAGAIRPACVPVEEDRILGKHLAAAEPAFAALDPSATVALTPAPGIRRRFSPAELSQLAVRHGIEAPAGAGWREICFERPTEPLTAERVMAALRAALPSPETAIELLDFCRLPLPRGELEFARTGLARPPGGSPRIPVIWRGRLRYAPSRSVAVWAKVRAWARREQVVAAEALPAGKPVAARQLRLETVEAPPFATPAAARIEEVAGRLLRRSVPAGQPVPEALLAAPNDVERGDKVAVEVESGGARLKFQATAESAGRAGDSILVRNPENQRRFRARVSGKGAVIVEGTENQTQKGRHEELSTPAGAGALGAGAR